MPAKTNFGNIVETRKIVAFEWKLDSRDFFSEISEANEYWESPIVYFSSAQWFLRLYPNGKVGHPCAGYVSLYLLKKGPFDEAVEVAFTVGLKANDGSVYVSSDCKYLFKGVHGMGCSLLVKRSQLLRDKEKISANDILTIFFETFVTCPTNTQMPLQNGDVQMNSSQETLPKCFVEVDDNSQSSFVQSNCSVDTAPEPSPEGTSSENEVSDPSSEGLDTMTQTFVDFLLNEKNCDITIQGNDREFQAHRLILAVRSPVFASQIGCDIQEKRKNSIIQLTDCKPDVFEDFLFYLYASKLRKMSTKHAVALYLIAHEYNVPQLTQECVKYILNNFTIESFCDIALLAVRFKETELLESSKNYFLKHIRNILLTTSWLSFMREHSFEANEFIKHFADKISV